jgi:putative ABC transport system permease protein
MRLACQNLLHDRVRLVVTVLGISFALCLMVFQGSLLAGFLRASAKLIDATQAELWITARGVVCFDFPASIPKRFIEISKGVPGVAGTSRIVTGMVEYRKPDGTNQIIDLIGADPEVGRRFPMPYVRGSQTALDPEGVLVENTSASLLGIGTGEMEINRLRVHVVGEVADFNSFLGTPYVFTSYNAAVRYLGLQNDDPKFILVRVQKGYSIEQVRSALAARMPEVDVFSREQFKLHSQIYWLSQTGAGGSILAAAVLGFLIGLVIVSQTIYATTMENVEEFATLKALGATRWYVARVVLIQAIICGVLGCIVGVGATFPLIDQVRRGIPWIFTPWWLPVGMIGPSFVMCGLAAIISIRTALGVEPARVFRA